METAAAAGVSRPAKRTTRAGRNARRNGSVQAGSSIRIGKNDRWSQRAIASKKAARSGTRQTWSTTLRLGAAERRHESTASRSEFKRGSLNPSGPVGMASKSPAGWRLPERARARRSVTLWRPRPNPLQATALTPTIHTVSINAAIVIVQPARKPRFVISFPHGEPWR